MFWDCNHSCKNRALQKPSSCMPYVGELSGKWFHPDRAVFRKVETNRAAPIAKGCLQGRHVVGRWEQGRVCHSNASSGHSRHGLHIPDPPQSTCQPGSTRGLQTTRPQRERDLLPPPRGTEPHDSPALGGSLPRLSSRNLQTFAVPVAVRLPHFLCDHDLLFLALFVVFLLESAHLGPGLRPDSASLFIRGDATPPSSVGEGNGLPASRGREIRGSQQKRGSCCVCLNKGVVEAAGAGERQGDTPPLQVGPGRGAQVGQQTEGCPSSSFVFPPRLGHKGVHYTQENMVFGGGRNPGCIVGSANGTEGGRVGLFWGFYGDGLWHRSLPCPPNCVAFFVCYLVLSL